MNFMNGKCPIGDFIKRFIIVLSIATICFQHTGYAQPAAHKVLVVTSNNDEVYLQVNKGISNVIAKTPSANIDVSTINLAAESSSGNLSDRLGDYDLIVSVGLNATSSVGSIAQRPPLLAVLIPLEAAKLYLSSPTATPIPPQRISAIVLDQPIERPLRLIKAIFNDTKSIGILLSPTSSVSKDDIDKLAKRFTLDIHTEMIRPGDNFFHQLGLVLGKSDIFLTLPDASVFNRQTAGNLLQTAYRHRIPLIGFARSHVKAGALAAVYSSPGQIGRQTGETILDYFSSGAAPQPAIQAPKYFSVAINRQVERSLGLIVPKESIIEEEIHMLENHAQ